jgi:hypothetical protein
MVKYPLPFYFRNPVSGPCRDMHVKARIAAAQGQWQSMRQKELRCINDKKNSLFHGYMSLVFYVTTMTAVDGPPSLPEWSF